MMEGGKGQGVNAEWNGMWGLLSFLKVPNSNEDLNEGRGGDLLFQVCQIEESVGMDWVDSESFLKVGLGLARVIEESSQVVIGTRMMWPQPTK